MKSRRMMWAGHITRIAEKRRACMVLVKRPKRKIPMGRPRHRWRILLKMYLRK
jgi:hypothetical protein